MNLKLCEKIGKRIIFDDPLALPRGRFQTVENRFAITVPQQKTASNRFERLFIAFPTALRALFNGLSC
jgi:hypothetical protein